MPNSQVKSIFEQSIILLTHLESGIRYISCLKPLYQNRLLFLLHLDYYTTFGRFGLNLFNSVSFISTNWCENLGYFFVPLRSPSPMYYIIRTLERSRGKGNTYKTIRYGAGVSFTDCFFGVQHFTSSPLFPFSPSYPSTCRSALLRDEPPEKQSTPVKRDPFVSKYCRPNFTKRL